ncbi:hypothetical protein CTE05_19850 [Cellulomonas terrae]|uniref:Uncharacterized protein n=1 Tax=Cellulomonas terrae TaxID=311234 RepID=A0A511JK99_9CELL|nr:hypothetical protein CTE05_19850 [Cellulomonas terrae]
MRNARALVATIDRFLPLLILSLDVYPVRLRGGTAVRGRPAEPAPCAAGQYAPAPVTTARKVFHMIIRSIVTDQLST